MSEGKLEWTTTDDVTGAEEATLPDGAKFALHNIMGTLSLMYVGKDGKGNVIYRTPVGVPMAFKKAKQEAEKFLGIKKDKKDDKKADKKEDEVEEELGPENEWGTDELTNKEKAVTPGQTPKKESANDTIRNTVKQYANLYRDNELAKQSREDDMHQRMLDMADLRKLLTNPPEEYAKRQYGSVEAYKKMIQNKIDKMNKKEGIEEAKKDKVDDNNGYGYDTYTAQKWCKSGKYIMQPMSFKAKGPKRWVLVPKDKNESLEDACWSGYKAIGTKEKDGKTVPNCVPESTNEDLKSLQDLLNNPDEEFAVKNYGSVERYKKMIQSKIDAILKLDKDEADKLGITPAQLRYRRDAKRGKNEDFSGASFSGAGLATLKPTDKISVRYGSIYVNDRPFEATVPDESLDWPNSTDSKGNLVTWFKGDSNEKSTWEPQRITGRYTDKEHAGVQENIEIPERYVKTVQLITKETDRSIVEAFLTKHSVAGRESNLLAINTEFKRFKKLHEAKIGMDDLNDLSDKVWHIIQTDDSELGDEIIQAHGLKLNDIIRDRFNKMQEPKKSSDWNRIAKDIADSIISDYQAS